MNPRGLTTLGGVGDEPTGPYYPGPGGGGAGHNAVKNRQGGMEREATAAVGGGAEGRMPSGPTMPDARKPGAAQHSTTDLPPPPPPLPPGPAGLRMSLCPCVRPGQRFR